MCAGKCEAESLSASWTVANAAKSTCCGSVKALMITLNLFVQPIF